MSTRGVVNNSVQSVRYDRGAESEGSGHMIEFSKADAVIQAAGQSCRIWNDISISITVPTLRAAY